VGLPDGIIDEVLVSAKKKIDDKGVAASSRSGSISRIADRSPAPWGPVCPMPP
jgi:hypothetical protein